MIYLQEIVDMLADVELCNIFYVDQQTKRLDPLQLPKLVRSINLGVLELHKRFNLKTGEVKVKLQDDIHRYYIRPERQVGTKAPATTVQYIEDGDCKLSRQTLLKIERVITECGFDMNLNNGDDFFNVNTPQFDIIEIGPHARMKFSNSIMRVQFRMAPKKVLVCEDFGDDWGCIQVDLPYTHLQALLYFVASRVHNPIGFTENAAHEGNNYAAKFETECANLEVLNLEVDQTGKNDRLQRGGWV